MHTEESPELNLTSRISAALPGGVTLTFATIVLVCPAAMFRGSGVKVMVAAGAIGVVVILTASLALPPGPVQVRDKRSFLYARKAGCATTCCERYLIGNRRRKSRLKLFQNCFIGFVLKGRNDV